MNASMMRLENPAIAIIPKSDSTHRSKRTKAIPRKGLGRTLMSQRMIRNVSRSERDTGRAPKLNNVVFVKGN